MMVAVKRLACGIALTVPLSLLPLSSAAAVPGDPMPANCATTWGGGLVCDGPIRPDGTFQRCGYTTGYYSPHFATGPGVYCGIVNPAAGYPPFTPPDLQRHIG